MFFSIDVANGVPIYEQLVRQVKYAVAEGILTPGQMIPSVRQLSQQLAINPNTIARAYQQLQTEQVVEVLRGRGLVIRTDAAKRCRSDRQEIIASRLRSVIEEALRGGYSSDVLQTMFAEQLQAAASSTSRPTNSSQEP